MAQNDLGGCPVGEILGAVLGTFFGTLLFCIILALVLVLVYRRRQLRSMAAQRIAGIKTMGATTGGIGGPDLPKIWTDSQLFT